MTEVEKMRSTQLADMAAPELQVRFEHAKKLLARMRGMSTYDAGYRELLEELVPEIPETSIICPPFHCDHGDVVCRFIRRIIRWIIWKEEALRNMLIR